jgi:hypothetical protein
MSVVPANECDCPIFNPVCFNIVATNTGGTTFQSGVISPLSPAITGTITFPTPYALQPQVLLTLNLLTGTTHINCAVSTFTVVSGAYTGFTWSISAPAPNSTISWISTQ